MSTLFCGYSPKENIALMASDTSLCIKDKLTNQRFEKISLIGDKVLLGTIDNYNTALLLEHLIAGAKKPQGIQEIIDKTMESLNALPAALRVTAYLLTVTDSGSFEFYRLSGLKEGPIRTDAIKKADSAGMDTKGLTELPDDLSKDVCVPYSCRSWKEESGEERGRAIWEPGYIKTNQVINDSLKGPLEVAAYTAITETGKVNPNLHNQEVVCWGMDRAGNIEKFRLVGQPPELIKDRLPLKNGNPSEISERIIRFCLKHNLILTNKQRSTIFGE